MCYTNARILQLHGVLRKPTEGEPKFECFRAFGKPEEADLLLLIRIPFGFAHKGIPAIGHGTSHIFRGKCAMFIKIVIYSIELV